MSESEFQLAACGCPSSHRKPGVPHLKLWSCCLTHNFVTLNEWKEKLKTGVSTPHPEQPCIYWIHKNAYFLFSCSCSLKKYVISTLSHSDIVLYMLLKRTQNIWIQNVRNTKKQIIHCHAAIGWTYSRQLETAMDFLCYLSLVCDLSTALPHGKNILAMTEYECSRL